MENSDEAYMQLAIQEAKKGLYQTWKNPMVGAVIVKDGNILATGHHIRYGYYHAERDAISKLTPEQLFNSTLYVTLEPCSHYGKQPPCSDLIVSSKIKRVVIAQVDPHQLVTGKGIAKLRQHNIQVTVGVLEDQAKKLNKFYTYFYQHNHPWITLKQAVSLDYRINEAKNIRTQITNETVYQRVHRERANYQAIMIGSNTAIIDNPSLLTTVTTDFPPIRIIVDRRGRLLNHLNIKLLTDKLSPTWIFTQNTSLAKTPHNENISIFLMKNALITEVIKKLTNEEIQSVYVEGGPTLANALLAEGQVNNLITYISPILLGQKGKLGISPSSKTTLHNLRAEKLDDNFRIEGEINV